MSKVPKIRSLHIFAISLENHGGRRGTGEVDFLPANEHESFLQVDSIILDLRPRHTQSTQNNKFTISLLYLKENVKNELDVLPTDKHQRFLQITIIILGMFGEACPFYPK